MSDVKFGLSQVNNPAPKSWRQFERAFIVAVSPALSGFLAVALTNQRHLAIAGAGIIFLNAIIKGFGMFLGNGTEYVDKQELETLKENQI
jgi:hypothetical protein